MKEPLKKCINGDNRPVKPPSWVLCAKCLSKLDDKFKKLKCELISDEELDTWERIAKAAYLGPTDETCGFMIKLIAEVRRLYKICELNGETKDES